VVNGEWGYGAFHSPGGLKCWPGRLSSGRRKVEKGGEQSRGRLGRVECGRVCVGECAWASVCVALGSARGHSWFPRQASSGSLLSLPRKHEAKCAPSVGLP